MTIVKNLPIDDIKVKSVEVYDSLCRNLNFKEKYKVMDNSEFLPIYNLMDSLGIPQNKKQEFFEQYYVPDLIGSECEILFVLESPHTDEIIHKHPLAGDSGVNLSKGLIDAGLNGIANANGCYLPFGCWLQENINTTLGKKFGIMNVCNFPMQSRAHSCTEQPLIKSTLEKIRVLIDKPADMTKDKFKLFFNSDDIAFTECVNLRTERKKLIQKKLITKDFKEYIGQLKTLLKKLDLELLFNELSGLFRSKLKCAPKIVILGYVALVLYMSVNENLDPDKVIFMPHPSHKSWNNKHLLDVKNSSLNIIMNSLADLQQQTIGVECRKDSQFDK